MEDHAAKPHPGPWRVMKVDSELAGLLVAVGFLMLGLVSMPLSAVFVLAAIAFGAVVALLLRFIPRMFSRWMVGTVIVIAAFVLWWTRHEPHRPHTVSSSAVYVLPQNVALGSITPSTEPACDSCLIHVAIWSWSKIGSWMNPEKVTPDIETSGPEGALFSQSDASCAEQFTSCALRIGAQIERQTRVQTTISARRSRMAGL